MEAFDPSVRLCVANTVHHGAAVGGLFDKAQTWGVDTAVEAVLVPFEPSVAAPHSERTCCRCVPMLLF